MSPITDDTYFAVYFKQSGEVDNVDYRNNGGPMTPARRTPIGRPHPSSHSLPDGVNEIHINTILGRPDASPCCYFDHITGFKYCWPPCG